MSAPPPTIDRVTLTRLLDAQLPAAVDATPALVLVHARYQGTDSAFPFQRTDGDADVSRTFQVTVSDQPSVLGAVDAWHRFREARPSGDHLLVITTGVADDLGWELRGRALKGRVLEVDRADLVRARFQARDADPRIARSGWLVGALLAAEPASGWRPAGSVLTLDGALQALVGARLDLDVAGRDGIDIAELLAWSQRPGAVDRYAQLTVDEQDGIAAWLAGQVGPGAQLLLALAAAGRGRDAMALGVVCSLVSGPQVSADAALALGGLLGGVPHRPGELRGLADAVTGTLSRWIAEATARRGRNGEARHSEPGVRVLDVVRRADQLAASAGLTSALAGSSVLPSALNAQLCDLAAALRAPTDPAHPALQDVAAAEAALQTVAAHGLVHLDADRMDVARMAVRLQRWLTGIEQPVTSVADGVSGHLSDWGWVDRALDRVWAGDPGGDGVLGHAYRRVHDAARARRERLDEQFAVRLAPWSAHACSQQPAGCLLVEDVLAKMVAPLVRPEAPPPLVLVLDGMSSAVAVELAEQVRDRGWVEASARPGHRAAAVSMLPTITRLGRASLLSGVATTGDQASEEAGFAAFWKRHARPGQVFHKGDLAGPAGYRLSDPVMQALSGPGLVAAVLNTIDDALDHGQEGDRAGWTVGRITYLADLLDAARGYGRPVVLTSDHGHVLDRSAPGDGPVATEGVQSARWRTGAPGPGEVGIRGPRVQARGEHVVLPWLESLRYTPRKAGYHGGASLAEVTVPVLVLFPAFEQIPAGWSELTVADVVPPWWNGQPTQPPEAGIGRSPEGIPARPPSGRSLGKAAKPAQEESLFDLQAAASQADLRTARDTSVSATTAGALGTGTAGGGLGALVVGTATYTAQKAFVRKAPDKAQVAAVIDALVAASGTLPIGTVAEYASRSGRRSEQVVTTLERLLNVEGYLVLSRIDGGRTVRLDVPLLRRQFGLGQ